MTTAAATLSLGAESSSAPETTAAASEPSRQYTMARRAGPNGAHIEGEGVVNLFPGEELTVTVGASTYSPVSFNTFSVGPFTARVTIQPDETVEDAYVRATHELLAIEQAEYEMALDRYFKRLVHNDQEKTRRSAKAAR